MHYAQDMPAEARLSVLSYDSRQQLPFDTPISTVMAPHAACRPHGRVLGEDNDMQPIGQSDESGGSDQDPSHVHSHVSQNQLNAAFLYIYLLFSQSGRRQTQPDLPSGSPWVEQAPQQTHRQHPSSLPAPDLLTDYTSNQAVVPSRHHNHSSTSLVPCSQAEDFTHRIPMADANGVLRHSNTSTPQSGAERIYESMKQHKDYKPGIVYEGVTVEANGVNAQGNIVTAQPDAPYRSHYYGASTVSGFNIQGDMPPELYLELAKLNAQQPQQQQQQQRHQQQDHLVAPPQQPTYRIIAGQKVPLPSNVPAFAGTGHSLRN